MECVESTTAPMIFLRQIFFQQFWLHSLLSDAAAVPMALVFQKNMKASFTRSLAAHIICQNAVTVQSRCNSSFSVENPPISSRDFQSSHPAFLGSRVGLEGTREVRHVPYEVCHV